MFILKKLKEYIVDYEYKYNDYKLTQPVYINNVENGFIEFQDAGKHIMVYKAGIRYYFERVYRKFFGNLFHNGQWIELTINWGNEHKQFLLNTDMKLCQYFTSYSTNYSSLIYEKIPNGNSVWKFYRDVQLYNTHSEYAITDMIINDKFKKCIVELYNFISDSNFMLVYIKSHKGFILHKIKRVFSTITHHYVRN